MDIKFSKMQSLGNDFVVIDATQQAFNLTRSAIQKIADRHFGIGCDQVLVLGSSTKTSCDFSYRIFNSDGSEIGQCGNGARCIARFIELNKLSDKTTWILETITTEISVSLSGAEVSVMMPVPEFLPEVAGAVAALDLGNPHLVFQVNDVDELNLAEAAEPYIQHPNFPEGVNIGFMQILDQDHIRLRVYERGAGATMACGSGACAAVIAGHARGLLSADVQVDQSGGVCWVSWQAVNSPAYLRGPAELCFVGIWRQE